MMLCEKKQCTGCFSCKSICSRGAISIQADSMGKRYPVIDQSKCIECGSCIKACHILNPPHLNRPLTAYAAWSKSEKDIYSSSGGIAAIFSRYILKNSGVVYGVGYKHARVSYIRIIKEEDIELLRGSKYVESDIDDTYLQVKNDLKQDNKVLFIGTPCQVAGLRLFLRKQYTNLFLVDLICHGVPPQQYLVEHVNKFRKKWDKVSFRGKFDFIFSVYDKDKIVIQKNFLEDEYFCAFYKCITFRDNCYTCRYSRIERCSDITIGDFWGLDRDSLTMKYDGRVSLILPNTAHGMNLLEMVADDLNYEERSIDEAVNPQQTNLIHPSEKTDDRVIFEKYYSEKGFDRAVMKTSLSGLIMKQKVRGTLKRTKIGCFLVEIKKRKNRY